MSNIDHFVSGIQKRGMDQFVANGSQAIVDTTCFKKLNLEKVLEEIDELVNQVE